ALAARRLCVEEVYGIETARFSSVRGKDQSRRVRRSPVVVCRTGNEPEERHRDVQGDNQVAARGVFDLAKGLDRPIQVAAVLASALSEDNCRRMQKTIPVAALAAMLLSAAYVGASSVCGDVNNSGSLTASDALAVLKASVGQGVQLVCSALGQLPKTGQTSCYNAGGSPIACSGTGQDAEFQKGAARSFTDNADGTVTDKRSGLMWEKLDDRNVGGSAGIHDKDNLYTWNDAFGKISDLNASDFAGHGDWRLPNRFELESLVNLGAVS